MYHLVLWLNHLTPVVLPINALTEKDCWDGAGQIVRTYAKQHPRENFSLSCEPGLAVVIRGKKNVP